MNEKSMSVLEHIVELRKRVIYVLILFVVSVVLGFLAAGEVIVFLQNQPVASEINMVVIDVTDAFKVYLQFAIFVGLVVCFPFVMYQVWAFVKPGLSVKERRMTLSYIPGAALLFLLGIAFAYLFLFPFIVNFMLGIAERLQAEEMYGMPQYFRFLFTFIFPFGFLFQMPLLVLFLTGLGILTPNWLKKMRKYAYFTLFVLAALITPPELMSHLIVTLPLIILYEVSILLSKLSFRRRLARQAKQNAEVIEISSETESNMDSEKN